MTFVQSQSIFLSLPSPFLNILSGLLPRWTYKMIPTIWETFHLARQGWKYCRLRGGHTRPSETLHTRCVCVCVCSRPSLPSDSRFPGRLLELTADIKSRRPRAPAARLDGERRNSAQGLSSWLVRCAERAPFVTMTAGAVCSFSPVSGVQAVQAAV